LGCYLKAPAQSGLFVACAPSKNERLISRSHRERSIASIIVTTLAPPKIPAKNWSSWAKACEQGKRDQVPQGWRHIHTASDLIA
jgi:hypothetical protein